MILGVKKRRYFCGSIKIIIYFCALLWRHAICECMLMDNVTLIVVLRPIGATLLREGSRCLQCGHV